MKKSAIAVVLLIIVAASSYGALQYKKFDDKRAEKAQTEKVQENVKVITDFMNQASDYCATQKGLAVITGTSTKTIACATPPATSTK